MCPRARREMPGHIARLVHYCSREIVPGPIILPVQSGRDGIKRGKLGFVAGTNKQASRHADRDA